MSEGFAEFSASLFIQINPVFLAAISAHCKETLQRA